MQGIVMYAMIFGFGIILNKYILHGDRIDMIFYMTACILYALIEMQYK